MCVACKKYTGEKNVKPVSIAVFLPGIRAESPVYNMLADGVEQAVTEAQNKGKSVSLHILEAGTNQAEWILQLTSLAASGMHDIIISSNPALSALAVSVQKQFPNQRFLLFDTYDRAYKNIASFQYNQFEQAWLAGTMAALVTSSDMKYANTQKKIGLIAGQEYPVMTDVILPAFSAGARSIDSEIEVDFRIIGNWSDAVKGAELARAMYRNGVDIIIPIAGGGNQGVIAAAQDMHFYLLWFDDTGYEKAPGLVLASAVLKQKKLAYEQTLRFINNELVFNTHTIIGMQEGYIDFIQDNVLYKTAIPEELQKKQAQIVTDIKSGVLVPKELCR